MHPKGSSRRTILKRSLIAAGMVPALVAQEAFAQAAPRDVLKDKRPVIHPGGSRLGVYDPYGDFRGETQVTTEHLFLPWEDVELGMLPSADAYAHQRGRSVLVTIEPWSWAKDWNISSGQLAHLVLSGQRDENMRQILQRLADFKSPVTVRWAQEMDNPYGRFTWAGWKPADYIAAFRRMHGLVRQVAPKARMMWSPRGENHLQNFYPGGEFVDLVGLTVFGLEKFDVIVYGAPRNFAQSLKQGYGLTTGYGKPIWVAELGYEGSAPYLEKWVQDATLSYPEYPQLKEVVYFNDREVWPWPHGLGYPNWRVVRGTESPYPQRGQP